MATISQRFRSRIAAPRQFVWDTYLRDGIFERLTPTWQEIRTLQQEGGVAPGEWRLMRVTMGPVMIRWKAVHLDWEPGYLFTDEQVEGPFAYWRHEHTFEDSRDGACILGDRVTYSLPLSPLSHWLGEPVARREVWRMFAFRHLISKLDIERHYRYRDQPRLRVHVSGTPDDAVEQLAAFLATGGHHVVSGATASGSSPPDARVDIAVNGGVEASISLGQVESGEPVRRLVEIDPAEIATVLRFATSHEPMFSDRGAAGPWAMREALFSAIYRDLMARNAEAEARR